MTWRDYIDIVLSVWLACWTIQFAKAIRATYRRVLSAEKMLWGHIKDLQSEINELHKELNKVRGE